MRENLLRIRVSRTIIFDLIYLSSLFLLMIFQMNSLAIIGLIVSTIIPVTAFIFKRERRNTKRIRILFVFQAFFTLYFAIQLYTGHAVFITVSSEKLVEVIINFGWGYITYYYMRRMDRNKIMRIFFVLCILLTIFQIIESGGSFRATITSLNINTLGLLCGYGFSFVIYEYSQNKNPVLLLLMIFFGVVVLFTGSRQAIIALSAPTAIYLVFQKRKNRFLRTVIVILLGIILFQMLMEIPVLYNIIGIRIETLLGTIRGGQELEFSAGARMRHYERAQLLIVRNPIFGYGLGSYEYLAGTSAYSHSNYMELLVSGGIISFILYYFPLVAIIWKMLRVREKTPLIHMLIGILATQVFIEFFLISYYRHFTLLVYIIVLVLLEKEIGVEPN